MLSRILAFAFLVSIIFLSCQKGGPPQPPPKLSLDTHEVDLGKVYAGEEKRTLIRLKNEGGDTLHIINVLTSCGCTAVKKPRPFLLGGESDIVEVHFNSSGLQGDVSRLVTIISNDPEKKSVNVTLKANIVDLVSVVSPTAPINLGKLDVGKKTTITFIVKNSAQNSISINGVEDRSGRLHLLSGPVKIPSQARREVKVSLLPQKEGFHNEMIFLTTDSKFQQRMPVRVIYTGQRAS
jgi:hypothetical protein